MSRHVDRVGEGNMVWTVIYRAANGDTCCEVVTGSHDIEEFRLQAKKKYKRLIASIKGNDDVVTETIYP